MPVPYVGWLSSFSEWFQLVVEGYGVVRGSHVVICCVGGSKSCVPLP